jgi:hypothetical protein
MEDATLRTNDEVFDEARVDCDPLLRTAAFGFKQSNNELSCSVDGTSASRDPHALEAFAGDSGSVQTDSFEPLGE